MTTTKPQVWASLQASKRCFSDGKSPSSSWFGENSSSFRGCMHCLRLCTRDSFATPTWSTPNGGKSLSLFALQPTMKSIKYLSLWCLVSMWDKWLDDGGTNFCLCQDRIELLWSWSMWFHQLWVWIFCAIMQYFLIAPSLKIMYLKCINFNFSILSLSSNFCPIKNNPSGYTGFRVSKTCNYFCQICTNWGIAVNR